MDAAVIAKIITSLGGMTIEAADRTLGDMHKDVLLAIGSALGVHLPYVGGDKPALICAALFHGKRY